MEKERFWFEVLAGVVMSMTQRHLDWVRVEFILYSQQGLPVGSTSDCRTSFGPNDLWKFQAPVAQTEAVKASDPLISCEYGRVAGGKILQAARPATPSKLPASGKASQTSPRSTRTCRACFDGTLTASCRAAELMI